MGPARTSIAIGEALPFLYQETLLWHFASPSLFAALAASVWAAWRMGTVE